MDTNETHSTSFALFTSQTHFKGLCNSLTQAKKNERETEKITLTVTKVKSKIKIIMT